MNYLTEINCFYDWLETNPLATSHISLWHALMHIANKAGWPDKFAVAVSVLELKTGLKKDAIYDARNKLAKCGRIEWESRKGNASAIYSMKSLASFKPTQIPTHYPTQEPTQHPTQEPTINKLNESKQNEVVDDVSAAVKMYEQEIDFRLTPMIVEKLRDDVETFGLDWVTAAMGEAVLNGKRNMKYFETILKRWRDDGYCREQRPWEERKKLRVVAGGREDLQTL